jgi:tetratricopeptide (TPR) repeat protein
MNMQRSIKEEVKFLQGKLEKKEDSILFARLADAYLQMDRIDEAIELCEKGIKKHPFYVTGHYVLGKCYLKKKLFDQAEKELKRVLLFDPKYIAAHRDYGELMAQIGWHNTCEMSYEEILRFDPFNETAKKRLIELKQAKTIAPIETSEEPIEEELDEVEEDILTELTTAPDEPPELAPESEPEPEIAPRSELEPELEQTSIETEEEEFKEIVPDVSPVKPKPEPVIKEIFKEADTLYEDDKVNLDLLEDIFRDDDLPDILANEDIVSPVNTNSNIHLDEEPRNADQGHLFGEEFKFEEKDEFENKELEGLDDAEVFALMTGDEEFNKPAMKSPLDITEPPVSRVQKSKVKPPEHEIPEETQSEAETELEPPIDKTLYNFQQQTKPKFEPTMDRTTTKKQKAIEQENQVEDRDTFDTNDLQRKKEKIVTPTLGEIYAAQHQYAKAIGVYEILRKKEPDNELYKQKIEYLQKKLEESQAE